MKILILSNNPNRPSFRQRIGVYLNRLKNSGVEYELVKFSKNKIKRYKQLSNAKHFDRVLLHKKTLNFFDALILKKASKKIIYDIDDAIMFSPNKPKSDKSSHMRLFKRTAGIADTVIAGNAYLAGQAINFCDSVSIIPTGLDTEIFKKYEKKKTDFRVRLVWIGSKATIKYLKEIRPALEAIGKKHKNIVLRIICDDFFELDNMPVEKLPWSLKGQYQDLVDSDIGLAPLPDNRFTRGKCGFKVLQYFSAGIPCITSPVGVNAELVSEGETGWHAKTLEEWTEKIELAINDIRHSGKQLSQNCISATSQYDVGIVGEQFLSAIKQNIY